MVRKMVLSGFASVLCLLAQSVSSGVAVPAIFPPPNEAFQELKTALGLSDSQLEQLRKILEERSIASRQISEQIFQKQTELNNLLRSGSRDATRIGQLTIDIHLLRMQPPAPDEQWRQRALTVLTPEQRVKLGPFDQAMKLSTTAHQAVTLNLIDPPPPGRPIILSTTLPALPAPGVPVPLPEPVAVTPSR
jgi:Spy/CpxP family protein refolding chaperone